MDGKSLTRAVLDCLDETAVSDQYAPQRRIYEALDQAAAIFCRETRCLHTSTAIATVAGQQTYDLPPDFIDLYLQKTDNRYFIKYNDGVNDSFPILTSYDRIVLANYTDRQSQPYRFSVMDKAAAGDLITGTATAAGAAANGQCILTDAAAAFLTTDKVYPRDIVHNTTDGSDGVVLSVTDATHLVCALFGGVDNEWGSGDSYVIQPAAERSLILDAPSESAGHTITVPYACMPAPVFADFCFWRFPPQVCKAIAWGAAAVLKTPKREFSEAAQIGGYFASEIKRHRNELALAALRSKRCRMY